MAVKMAYRFNLEKEARKPLVAAIGELLGVKPRYLAAPGYGYEIGGCKVDRCGTVTFENGFDAGQICFLLKELAERGFEFEPFGGEDGGVADMDAYAEDGGVANTDAPPEDSDTAEATAEDGDTAEVATEDGDVESTAPATESGIAVVTETFEDDSYIAISVPMDGFTPVTLENLKRLVTAKSWILKTMTGADVLPISYTKTRISFPWFNSDSDYKAVDAYSRLVAALCDTAKKKQRVTSVERPAGEGENPRYKARCFLLSLGFIGDGYAQARKILLAGFSGNGSHCTGDGKKSAADNAYTKNGYAGRKDYLAQMSREHDVPLETVLALADALGENEDFDGLVSALQDYRGESA